jgi:cell division protein FtsX
MAPFSTAAIGLRLALGGGRVGVVRLALVAIGVALGVSLLLVGLGVGPAREARNARELAREPVLPVRAPENGSYLLWSAEFDRFRGRPLFRAHIAGVGERPPLPPGIERLPAPGELAVSPALARLLRSREGMLLRPRVPGRIVELVGKDGLAWPGELLAYAGAARGEASANERFYPVTGFRGEGRRGRDLPLPVKLVILVAVLGLLIPTLSFIAASSRVSAAARERRLAAIRLLGATPAQARLLTAVESAVAAALGCVAGVALFFALRPFAAALAPEDYELFPSDIAPPLAQAVATVLAVPLLAIGAGLFALRRVELSPLGIVRHARVRRVGPRRAVPLVLGFTALVAAWLDRDELVQRSAGGDDTLALLLVGPGFVLVLLGVATVTPWLAGLAARLLVRVSRNVGTLIAARRLVLEPSSAGRLVSGAVLAVFVATVAHAFLPPLVGAADSESRVVSAARPGTLFVGTGAPPDELASTLRGVDGVRTVAPIGAVSAVPPPAASGPPDFGVLVADCAALNRVLVQPLPRCTTARGYRLVPPSPYAVDVDAGDTLRLLVDPDRSRKTVPFRLPNRLTNAPARSLFGDDVSVLLPPDVVPVGAALHTREGLVATDGGEDTVERVRNALARAGIVADVATATERVEERTKDARSIVALIDLATLLVLVIAAAGLLVASIDSVLERRRPLAVLVAVGTPVSLLRRAVLLQAAIPLVCGLAVAAAAALLTSTLVLPLTDAAFELPLRPLAILTAIAAVAVLAVSGLTLPTLARAVRPETLRSE